MHRTIVWLTWRQIFANRRLYLAMLFSLAPVVIALLFRSFSADPEKESRGFYLLLAPDIVLGVLLPLSALVFGTTAFGGEIDDGTLLYLLVKPVKRWRIVISKYVVAVLSTFLLMLPAIFLPWLAVSAPDLPISIPVAYVWGAALGAILYGAFFTMLGAAVKHPLVIGLMYIVIIEEALARSIAGVKALSIREFATAFSLRMADSSLNLGTPLVSASNMKVMGTLFLVGSLALALYRLARYEMAEKP
ncbi:MAG TPA: ABC transporter permease [Gemmatimonadaceae bacterium]|nr:ABC transporter permease [Gemmatimonadaceae bacterium]